MKSASAIAIVLLLAGCTTNQRPNNSQTSGTECKPTSEQEIAALFGRWNESLQRDAQKVVANYAERSILLATQSNTPRITPAEKEEYFAKFLLNRPSGEIKTPRLIVLGCNSAVDSGLYDFTFRNTNPPTIVHARYTFTYQWNGTKWLITSHHSSVMPEE
jgi:hypothetical protein